AKNPPFPHRRAKLVQRSIRLLLYDSKDAIGIVFQNRAGIAPRFRRTHPMTRPRLQPLNRNADIDFKALGRLTRGASSRLDRLLECFGYHWRDVGSRAASDSIGGWNPHRRLRLN